MQNESTVDKLAQKIWEYGLMHHQLQKADAVAVFGSYNPIVANRAAELFLQGYAPVIVFSGSRSDSTLTWEKTESETLAEVAIAQGVPKEKILLETEAKNSGENTRFTKLLLAKHGLNPQRIIVIQKPYAERRTFATVRQQWPSVEVIMSSPQLSYQDYMAASPIGKDRSISTMVGDLQRIKLYAEKGFQIPQTIPDDVWVAYEELVKLGYTKALA